MLPQWDFHATGIHNHYGHNHEENGNSTASAYNDEQHEIMCAFFHDFPSLFAIASCSLHSYHSHSLPSNNQFPVFLLPKNYYAVRTQMSAYSPLCVCPSFQAGSSSICSGLYPIERRRSIHSKTTKSSALEKLLVASFCGFVTLPATPPCPTSCGLSSVPPSASFL